MSAPPEPSHASHGTRSGASLRAGQSTVALGRSPVSATNPRLQIYDLCAANHQLRARPPPTNGELRGGTVARCGSCKEPWPGIPGHVKVGVVPAFAVECWTRAALGLGVTATFISAHAAGIRNRPFVQGQRPKQK